MEKIRKALQTCTYLRSYTARHPGGRSFYNDGTYVVDVYDIGGGYFLHHKCTGRPAYYLYDGERLADVRFTQRDFVNEIVPRVLYGTE